jgi:hypothetical protein
LVAVQGMLVHILLCIGALSSVFLAYKLLVVVRTMT